MLKFHHFHKKYNKKVEIDLKFDPIVAITQKIWGRKQLCFSDEIFEDYGQQIEFP